MEKKTGKYIIIAGLVIILLASIAILSSQKESYKLLPSTEAQEMFEQLLSSENYRYKGEIVNQPSCFSENYCGNEPKELELNEGLLSYLKEEKLESLDRQPLQPMYCECFGDETINECSRFHPYVFACVNKNKDITYLFHSSPAPCADFTIYILPKLANSIEDLVKPEFLVGENIKEKTEKTLTFEYTVRHVEDYLPLEERITIEPNKIILRSDQLTCP